MKNTIHYFGAGPAALPHEVKLQIQTDIANYRDTQLSILELSHRSPEFSSILDRATNNLRELYSLPSHYHVLFMHGGATTQFDAIPLNLLGSATRMTYVDTGFWSRKAAEIAKKYGDVQLLKGLSSQEDVVCCCDPRGWELDERSAYVHVTPNETIDGISLQETFDTDIPVIADMTSCLLMQPMDISQYGMVYAGAQKTLGIAGLAVVIIRDDLLERVARQTPFLFRYDVHVRERSIVNTSPVFACYVAQLMLDWVKEKGGIQSMHTQARARAAILYNTIDEVAGLVNKICVSNRSCINVVFDFTQEEKLAQFLMQAREQGLLGLEGHRLVGGVRASMYNGTPMIAVEHMNKLLLQGV